MDQDLEYPLLVRTGPAIIEGKDHECRKNHCAYCRRLEGKSTKGIISILDMPGVRLIEDKRELLLRQIYAPALKT